METFEEKKFISSGNTTAEKILYYISNLVLIADIIVCVCWFASWYVDRYSKFEELCYIIALLLASLVYWSLMMGFLKMINLFRHIYNRIDDMAPEIKDDESEENE